jgi:phage gp36-like protein
VSYVTHEQLAERPGALELAQVASDPQLPVVEAELMEATLLGGDRSAWLPGDVTAADSALARIDVAVADADGLIDGYLVRGKYSVPLAPVPRVVSGWSRDIARYTLHKDRIADERSDPIARAYRDALKLLQLVAEGRFSLGIDDPKAPVSDSPQYAAEPAVFTRQNLADFQ